MAVQDFSARYRVVDGAKFRLADCDPADTGNDATLDKARGEALLARSVKRLSDLQERLYAQGRWAFLGVLQAMDAGGKDGAVRHVMSGVNPAGVRVTSFKAPGPDELTHDFLWRVHREVPGRGTIGIFNRSHYEEVLTVRLNPALLDRQRLPERLRGPALWRQRLDDIAAFEAYLARQGVVIVKLFLNISKNEQRKRLLARLDEPAKTWKFDPDDLAQRVEWDDYQAAYQEAIAATAAPHAPWFVVPADHKWFAHLVVADAMCAALEALDLSLPEPGPDRSAALDQARRALRKD